MHATSRGSNVTAMWRRFVATNIAIGLALAALYGCRDSTAPERTLNFCSAPSWVAIRNDGSPEWQFVPVDGKSVTLRPTSKLSIAYSFSIRDAFVWSLTADELREMRFGPGTIGCFPDVMVPKTLSGTVTGVPAGQDYAVVSRVAFASRNGLSFSLFAPDGPQDVLAWTFENTPELPVQRVIIRRSVDLPDGSTIPTFDFSSPESVGLDSASLSLTNLGTVSSFTTSLVTRSLEPTLRRSGSAAPPYLHAVPTAILLPEDYHALTVSDCAPMCRQLSYYYRAVGPTSLALGPMAAAANKSVVSTNPCVRLRITIPSQPEYPSFAHAEVVWASLHGSQLFLGVTRAFLSATPSTWTLDLPELNRPDGSCLVDAAAANAGVWVTVGDGRFALFAGYGHAVDGDVLHLARVAATAAILP